MNWADGYHTTSDYTHGYYRQTNPVVARCLLTLAGFAVRDLRIACELGYGHGVSLALHAAASGAIWYGTDFMPAHAQYAQALAEGIPAAALLTDQGFDEFCARTDLPDFDFICAHGIWSWVSAANRAVIVDFLRRKLRPGGVFFVSYNTETGWASLRPFRDLLRRHVLTQSPPGMDPQQATARAVAFMQQVYAAEAVYARQNPLAPAMLAKISEEISAYHAHEYLGEHWNPLNFADLDAELGTAKLVYAGSGSFLDHVPGLDMLGAQRDALALIEDSGLRETARELLLGVRFRRDYWIKGGLRLPAARHQAAVADLRFVLGEPRRMVTEIRPATAAGEVNLPIAAFDPVLDAMADHLPHRLGDLAATLAHHRISAEDVRLAVLTLAEVGAVQPAQAEDVQIDAAEPATRALNARLLACAREDDAIGHLARPVSGGATDVPRPQLLLLLAEREGVPQAERVAYAGRVSQLPRDQLDAAAATLAAGRRAVLRIQRVC